MAKAIIIGVGDSVYSDKYKTWGSLRTVFAERSNNYTVRFNDVYPVMVPGDNLKVAFKSAAPGSGLIRADANMVQNYSSQINFRIIAVNTRTNPSPPPPLISDWQLSLDWWDYLGPSVIEGTLVSVELQEQLIGQTVTTSSGVSFQINSTLFTTTFGRQTFLTGTASNPGSVVSVGKLTPVT